MADNYNTLTDIIKRCYQGAALNPGTPSRHRLEGGLRLSILMTRKDGSPNHFRLQLDRKGSVGPSLAEWQTMLKHWPWHVDLDHQPKRIYMVGDMPPRE